MMSDTTATASPTMGRIRATRCHTSSAAAAMNGTISKEAVHSGVMTSPISACLVGNQTVGVP